MAVTSVSVRPRWTFHVIDGYFGDSLSQELKMQGAILALSWIDSRMGK